MESVVESLLGNARCEESSFGRVGSRHQRGQQRHCPAKLRNNAQNKTEFPQEMGILRNNAQNRTEFPQEMGILRNAWCSESRNLLLTNPNVKVWLQKCKVMSE